MSANTDCEFLEAYNRIKVAHEQILEQLKRAIDLDECNDKPLEAKSAYDKCIASIYDIFDMRLGLPDNIENNKTKWKDACNMIEKLKKIEIDIQQRLELLKQRNPILGEPVSKEKDLMKWDVPTECCLPKRFNNNSNNISTMYKQIIKHLKELMAEECNDKYFHTLFQSPVKLYKIESDGSVKTLSSATNMEVILCTNFGENLKSVYFIKCSIILQAEQDDNNQSNIVEGALVHPEYELIWIYPLIPNGVTCYVTDYNAFILPDLGAQTPSVAFGIILKPPVQLNEETAKDFQQLFADLLEAILKAPISMQAPIVFECQGYEPLSKNITVGANFIARNLIRAAEKSGELMVKSTPYIISKLKSSQDNTVNVSPVVQNSIKAAYGVTSIMANTTTWIASKIGNIAKTTGQYLAPYIQSGGATILEKVFNYDNERANNTMEEAFIVAAKTIEAVYTIIDGLEKSAVILGNNISENSVNIIEHMYGRSAAAVAADTFGMLGNAFIVSRTATYVVPKGIAKNLVKNTGKAVITEYNRCRYTPQYITAGHLYPDLRHLKKTVTADNTSTQ